MSLIIARISVFGSVVAIIYCLIIDDLKLVIAYRRIGHIGLVVATVLRDNDIGLLRRLLIIVGHGFTSSLIFYLGNDVYMLTGTRRLSLVKGLIRTRSIIIFFLCLVLVLNISFPPSINLFGEITAIISMTRIYPLRTVLVLLLVLLGGAFNIKLYVNVAHGSNCGINPKYKIRRQSIVVRVLHFRPYLILPFIF